MILQPLAELRCVFGGSEGVDEPLEGGDGGVDLEYSGGHRLRGILLAVEVAPPGTERPASLDVLKAHCIIAFSLRDCTCGARVTLTNFLEKNQDERFLRK